MRIPITQTELIAMPNIAWRKFLDFLFAKDLEHTPIQKATALCSRYYFGMQGDGHKGFFDYYDYIDKDELAQALAALVTPEFAENLTEAIENGSNDNYAKTNAWFFENGNTLLNAIEEIWQNNTDEFYEIIDENYTLVPPKDGVWVGAIIAAVVGVFMFIAASTNPNPEDRRLFILVSIFTLAFIGLAFILYAKRLRLSVKKDVLTACFLFLMKRTIRFDEISDVKERSKDITIYANGRRFVKINKRANGFGMLWAQLNIAEKIVDKQKIDFSIRLPKVTIINSIIWLLICVGAFIWTYQWVYHPTHIYVKVFLLAAMLTSFGYFFCCLQWKITVLANNIVVKKAFRNESEYQISDIIQVNIENQKMVIWVNEKIAANIPDACEGYPDLVKRLQNANIPFFRDGKRWKYETVPIEEQLVTLGNLGIHPKHDDFIEWVRSQWGIEVVKADPYNLLMLLGGARKSGDTWEYFSDDVFFFDMECVDDSNSYMVILERLAALSKGAFNITNICSEVDHDSEKASVSFDYNNATYRWDLDYYDDWFDPCIIRKINDLLMSGGSARFFYGCYPPGEQGVIIVFDSEKMIEELNLLTDYPFAKMETVQTTGGFSVKQNRSNIKGSIFSTAVFGSFLILTLLTREAPVSNADVAQNFILHACLCALTFMGLIFLINALRWKLMVTDDILSVRRMIGKEKTYAVKSIIRVDMKTGSAWLRIGKKKIRVAKNCENVSMLMARLHAEKIPFYYKQ